MKFLDVQARLEYARAAVAVLRALKIVNKTMRYKEFGQAIGLLSDSEPWEVWHRQQTGDILSLAAAVEGQAGDKIDNQRLEFERIVNAEGQPGEGFLRETKIVKAK